MSHIQVAGPWLRYSAQALGRSDRKVHAHALTQRIMATVTLGESVHTPTAQVVSRTLKEHAAALSLLGLSAQAPPLIDGVEKLTPTDPFVTSARLRLAQAERRERSKRPIELRDLLRF